MIKAQVEPHLKPSFEYDGERNLYFVIRNTGGGAAHDVTARWESLTPAAPGRSWRVNTIPSGKAHHFRIPLPGHPTGVANVSQIREALRGLEGEIKYQAACKDIQGNDRYYDDKITLKNALDRLDDSHEEPRLEPVQDIGILLDELIELIDENVSEMRND